MKIERIYMTHIYHHKINSIFLLTVKSGLHRNILLHFFIFKIKIFQTLIWNKKYICSNYYLISGVSISLFRIFWEHFGLDLWYCFPLNIYLSPTISAFLKKLKTVFFQKYFWGIVSDSVIFFLKKAFILWILQNYYGMFCSY